MTPEFDLDVLFSLVALVLWLTEKWFGLDMTPAG